MGIIVATKTESLRDFLLIHAHPPDFAKMGMGIDDQGWGCHPLFFAICSYTL